jgi:hypothetical protein
LPYTKGLVKVLEKFGANLVELSIAPVYLKGDGYNKILDLVPNLESLTMICPRTNRLLNWRQDLSTIRLPMRLTTLALHGVRMSPSMLRNLESNPRARGITSLQFMAHTKDVVKLSKILDSHEHIRTYSHVVTPFNIPAIADPFAVWTVEFIK